MKRLLQTLCCFALVGCSTGGETPNVPDEPAPAAELPGLNDPKPAEQPPVEERMDRPAPAAVGTRTDDEGGATLKPVTEEEPATRPRRRLNVDQLSDAMRKVSGGIGWTERRGNNDVDLFNELAATLGKPDYVQRTEEDLEPTILFQKFLDDAARTVCRRMIDVDAATLEVEMDFAARPFEEAPDDLPVKTVMMEVDLDDTYDNNAEAIDANLRAMLIRFHGKVVDESNDVALANWRWMMKSSFHVAEPVDAWHAACVAMFTHPDFYTY